MLTNFQGDQVIPRFVDLLYLFYLEFHWLDPENRRKFFDNFAQKKGFDPNIAENWYHGITSAEIMQEKVCLFAARFIFSL